MDLIDLVERKNTNFNSNESRLSCYIVKISLNIIEKRSNTIIYVFTSPYEHDILIIGQKTLRKYCSQWYWGEAVNSEKKAKRNHKFLCLLITCGNIKFPVISQNSLLWASTTFSFFFSIAYLVTKIILVWEVPCHGSIRKTCKSWMTIKNKVRLSKKQKEIKMCKIVECFSHVILLHDVAEQWRCLLIVDLIKVLKKVDLWNTALIHWIIHAANIWYMVYGIW